MKEFMKFAKSTGIYLLGNVLSKALSFILLPLYTKYITPTDFGTYDLNIALNTFIYSILFLDIWSGVMRFIFEYTGDKRGKSIFSGMIIYTISTISYLVILLLVGMVVHVDYIGLLFLVGFVTGIQQIVGYTARAFGKNSFFVFSGLIGSLATLVLNIVLIVNFHMNYSALYISTIVGLGLNTIILAKAINFKKYLKREYYDRELFNEMVKFSLPLSVNSAAYWFLTGFNRVVISDQLSVAENGLYAVATKFSSIIQLVTTCFQMAWQELSFSKSKMSRKEMSSFYSKSLNEYIKFLYLGLIIALPVVRIIFPFVINKQYGNAMNLAPIALYATFFSSISSFLSSIISILKKNSLIFTTTLVGAIVNVIVIVALINVLGVQAANISLCVGFFVNVVMRVKLINRDVKLTIDYKILVLLTALFILSVAIYVLFSNMINLLFFVLMIPVFFFIYKDKIMAIIKR